MKKRIVFVLLISAAMSGCAINPIDGAFKTPVANAKTAQTAASAASDDAQRIVALGLIGAPAPTFVPSTALSDFAFATCSPMAGPYAAAADLGTFVDFLTALDAAAQKPTDTTLRGYIVAIHADGVAATGDPADAEKKAQAAELKATQRCIELATADIAATVNGSRVVNAHGAAGVPGDIVSSLDALATAIAAGLEGASREDAIRQMTLRMIPIFQAASAALTNPAGSEFGPMVAYTAAGNSPDNSSVLAASINLHRWYTLRMVYGEWKSMEGCRLNTGSCLTNPQMIAAADAYVADIAAYRALAAIDPVAIQKQLDDGILKAQKAAEGNDIGQLIDGFLQVGDALGTINDKYTAYNKARGAS